MRIQKTGLEIKSKISTAMTDAATAIHRQKVAKLDDAEVPGGAPVGGGAFV